MADKRLRLIVEAVTSQAQQAIRSFGNQLRGFGDEASRNLEKPTKAAEGVGAQLGTLATAAAVFGAAIITHYARMAASTIDSMAEMAAKNLELGEGFRMVAARMGIDADDLVKRLQDAARGTIGAYQTMGLAIKALDLGIGASTDDLVKLMEIAHVRAKRYGMSTAEAFQLLIDGISSGRPMMLRHLGFLADTEKAYEAIARSMGKDADELTLLQQKQAVYQAILQTGQPDIEAWVTTVDDAGDAFARNEVATARLRQELGERFLPTVVTVKEAMTGLLTVMLQMENPITREQTVFAELVKTTGSVAAATEAFAKNIEIGSQGLIDHEQALVQAGKAATLYTNALIGAPWGKMYQDSARARMAIQEVGDTSEETATDLEALAKAQKQASDIMADYGRSVAQEEWQMARRVADAQFSMTQAAENAALDLYKIQRDGADRSGDLLAAAAIRDEADTARHYANLRYMKQDLNDSLADMDWDYQRERSDIMEKAPWWIRYALSAEYAQRERIAATGDAKALEQYDEYLNERIKAIDPAYAIELDKLEEQHEHAEDIENREAGQSLERAKEDWQIQQREQDRAMNQQFYELDRQLGYQLDEWRFHDAQRLESERNSMANLITEHAHSLDVLWTNTQAKLADIAGLWEVYGREAMEKWITGMDSVPWPSKEGQLSLKGAGYQRGLEYVPRTMPVVVHKGESILPAGEAAQYRQGGAITINLTVGGAWSPYQGQQIAAQIATELGQGIRRSYR